MKSKQWNKSLGHSFHRVFFLSTIQHSELFNYIYIYICKTSHGQWWCSSPLLSEQRFLAFSYFWFWYKIKFLSPPTVKSYFILYFISIWSVEERTCGHAVLGQWWTTKPFKSCSWDGSSKVGLLWLRFPAQTLPVPPLCKQLGLTALSDNVLCSKCGPLHVQGCSRVGHEDCNIQLQQTLKMAECLFDLLHGSHSPLFL